MKKWIALLCIVFNGTGVALASPISGYSQFIQSLDSIVTGAVMPIADEQHLAARSSILPMVQSGQAAQLLAVASTMLGQPVVWGGATPAQGFD